MHLKVSEPKITQSGEDMLISFRVDERDDLLKNAEYVLASKVLDIDIARYHEKRSVNANALFWAMCQRLADALDTTNDEMYLELLNRYGTSELVTCDHMLKEEFLNVLRKHYRIIKVLDGVTPIDGHECVQFLCYRGSHEYNSKEMARLVRGTLADCRELHLPTEPDADVEAAIEQWGSKKENSKKAAEFLLHHVEDTTKTEKIPFSNILSTETYYENTENK